MMNFADWSTTEDDDARKRTHNPDHNVISPGFGVC